MSDHLVELLGRAASEVPDQVALVEIDPAGSRGGSPYTPPDRSSARRTTWAELDAEVGRVAASLEALGLVAGYRVVLAMVNRTELVTTYLATMRAGLVAVPVNPRSATGELARVLADCGARLVVADGTTVATVRQAVAGLQDALVGAEDTLVAATPVPRTVVLGAPLLPGELAYADLLGSAADPRPFAPADPERLAALLYTSGTSGGPRAAMLSHRALAANVEQVAAVRPPMITGGDVVLGVLPLFHVYGLNAVLGQVLRQRARLVVVAGFDPAGTLDVVEGEAVSVLPLAPPVVAACADLAEPGRLAAVRLVLSGSAPLAEESARAFTDRTGLAVHQGYGLTEAAPVVTSTLPAEHPRPGSVGAALPGVDLRLQDESGHEPEAGDAGEILVRGANLFTGWWPDASGGPDADGWYATGDVGFLDAAGDLYLVDRLTDLVVVSGFNVYPREVEQVLADLDDVGEAAVIGAADASTGEAVVAYVTPADGTVVGDGAALVDAVRSHCAGRLARFKRPSEVHVVDALPHTVTGKVAKGRLRASRGHADAGLLR